jgi:hypothetical protein
MKPQATIEQHSQSEHAHFTISIEDNGQTRQVDNQFPSYEDCLSFISENDWQVKREPSNSLNIPTQFMRP